MMRFMMLYRWQAGRECFKRGLHNSGLRFEDAHYFYDLSESIRPIIDATSRFAMTLSQVASLQRAVAISHEMTIYRLYEFDRL